VDDNDEFEHLLARARAGDKPALNALLERLRARVRQRAHGLLGPRLAARLDASDIAQEVDLQAWANLGQLEGQTVPQLLAWVDKIVQNIITDRRREHGAKRRDAKLEVAGGDLFPGIAADATTPSQGALRNEDQVRLAQALQHLPEKQRLVVQLRLYEGLPYEEVAERVGVTVGNARVLLLRATEKLAQELGEHS
jgi:RNA polymerase sigma-70 factor (ECF subfamily)